MWSKLVRLDVFWPKKAKQGCKIQQHAARRAVKLTEKNWVMTWRDADLLGNCDGAGLRFDSLWADLTSIFVQAETFQRVLFKTDSSEEFSIPVQLEHPLPSALIKPWWGFWVSSCTAKISSTSCCFPCGVFFVCGQPFIACMDEDSNNSLCLL